LETLKESILTENINEATDVKKVYDSLKKGSVVRIKYGSPVSKNNQGEFVVSKGKTVVGKSRVERISLKNTKNPSGMKYYLYNRNGKVSFAMGDMAATIDDIDIIKESLIREGSDWVILNSIGKAIDTRGGFFMDADDPGFSDEIQPKSKEWDQLYKKASPKDKKVIDFIMKETIDESTEINESGRFDITVKKYTKGKLKGYWSATFHSDKAQNGGIAKSSKVKNERGEPIVAGPMSHFDKLKKALSKNYAVNYVSDGVSEAAHGYKDSTAGYIKNHNDEYKAAEKINKSVKGDEMKFYDELEKIHDKLKHAKYMVWLSNALRGYKVDMYKDPKIKNKAEAEEALYLLSK
jgi:hypothetical protein